MQPGTRLGPYEIVSALGAGGMGEVYRARDSRLHRDVAVKVLPPHSTGSPAARERFEREARAVAALQHPNICTVHDVGETADGSAFLVMELLQGETLQQRLTRGPLDQPEWMQVSSALADALHVAHTAGIVHRDLKPANIILTARGAKILDFGLAKTDLRTAEGDRKATAAATRAQLTEAGSTIGTVAYMSPEQLRGEDVDARSDLFSLGLVMFEMATGRHAFAGATSPALSAAILHDPPPSLRTLRPSLAEGLEAIVLKALEKDRELRYQQALDLRTDLQRLDRGARAVSRQAPATVGSRRLVLGAGVVLFLVIVGGIVVSRGTLFRTPPHLTDSDTIVLGDFANSTGDPVFDDALRQGLSVQLQQSPLLRLLSNQKIASTLGLMGVSTDTRLTPAIARQVCERTASAAVLDGSIARLGSQYVLGLRATDCRTGELIDQQQGQASRKEDVLATLAQIATTFRTRVGESLATVQSHATPLAEATTVSLDALKAYTAGLKAAETNGNAAGIPFLKRAVEIDPNFAMAHAILGLNYSGSGEMRQAIESIRKAYEHRNSASDPERFFIQFVYNRDVTGDLEATYQTLRLWNQTYPHDTLAQGLLGGFATNGTGRYDEALQWAEKSVAVEPDNMFAWAGRVSANLSLERFDAAEAALRLTAERKVEGADLLILGLHLGFLRHDEARMAQAAARAKGTPQEDWIMHAHAMALASSGHLQQATTLTRAAMDTAQKAGRTESAALYAAAGAIYHAFLGNASDASREAATAVALSKGRDVEYGAAIALALTGDFSRTESLAAELERRSPEDTNVRFTYVPALRRLSALGGHDLARALDSLRANQPYELAQSALPYKAFVGALYPVYIRGLVYLAQGRPAEALTEFAKIRAHPGLVLEDPVGVMAIVQRGRAFANARDVVKARAAYEEFFTLWTGADPDVPLLVKAKAEYAKLH